jgi:hypothetical protein
MAESVYKIIELVGTSTTSWEKAAAAAIGRASKSLRDLRIAEVSQLDMALENGKPVAYRARVKVSFKFDTEAPAAARERTPEPVTQASAPAAAAAPQKAPKKAAKKKAAKKAPKQAAAPAEPAAPKKAPKKAAKKKTGKKKR